ncbi:MAG: radical SAM protein [Candidatus Eremiobacteraeota bacterium]|nr:radical SAM protein [Candidatus Eremiobacteraeota bacterium]
MTEILVKAGRREKSALYGNIGAEAPPPQLSRHAIEQSALHLVLSPFVHFWKKRERAFAFHSLLLKRIYGDPALYVLLQFLSREPTTRSLEHLEPHARNALARYIPALVESSFLVTASPDPLRILDAYRSHPSVSRPDFQVMYLLLTHLCNLKCHYCFFVPTPSRAYAHPSMDRDTARLSVELFDRVLGRSPVSPVVILYGGEPLLNWDTLAYAVKLIRSMERRGAFGGREVTIELFTNATLVTNAMAGFFKKHGVLPLVSLDGFKHHHDKMRLESSGKGSYERALRGFSMMRRQGIEPAVGCTLGPHNIDDLEEIACFFKETLGVGDIRIFAVRGLPGDNPYELPPPVMTGRLISLWKSPWGPHLEEILPSGILSSLAGERCTFHSCDTAVQLSVMPDGSAGPCINLAEEFQCLWGNVRDAGIAEAMLKGGMSTRWRKRSPLNDDKCLPCIGLALCGGGCAHDAWSKTGSPDEKDERQCRTIPPLVRWAVEVSGGSGE